MKLTKHDVIKAAYTAIESDPTLTKQQFIQKFMYENNPELTRWTISTYVSNLPFANTKGRMAKKRKTVQTRSGNGGMRRRELVVCFMHCLQMRVNHV